MLRVKKIRYLVDYKLKITFSNLKTKVIDFEKWVFEDNFYFKPLRDLDFFKQVQLDEYGYSISWPNGADFSPDVLYEAGREIRRKRRSSKTIKSRSQKIDRN